MDMIITVSTSDKTQLTFSYHKGTKCLFPSGHPKHYLRIFDVYCEQGKTHTVEVKLFRKHGNKLLTSIIQHITADVVPDWFTADIMQQLINEIPTEH